MTGREVLVDPPLFIAIFKASDPRHVEFKPVLHWLRTSGRLVYGGTEYVRQLQKVASVLGFITELDRSGRIRKLNTNEVDSASAFADEVARSKDLDDAFLIGIVSVSGVRVVCVDDPRSHRFLKRRELYMSPVKPPKLYTGSRNQRLLRQLG